ncbi:MAG: hypothetical protein HY875_15430 [Chloroflexi bacterium]|nr:hypothetical protein [Chloroflexota bacterium]
MTELQGIARFKFHPGMVEEFKRLAAEAMDIVRARDLGPIRRRRHRVAFVRREAPLAISP